MTRDSSSLDYRGASVLVTLLEGPMNPQAVANKLKVSRQTASRSINMLIKEELVVAARYFKCPHCGKEIESLPIDPGERILELTETGRKVAEKISEVLAMMK